jgi:hypothetical protein
MSVSYENIKDSELEGFREVIDDLFVISTMIYEMSNMFEGVEAIKRKARSTAYLSLLFDCVYSILRNLPFNKFSTITDNRIDNFLLFSLMRNTFENTNNMYFFSLETTNDDENDFREILFDFNADKQFQFYSGKLFDKKDEVLENRIKLSKKKLKYHPFFQTLPEFKKEKILGGLESRYHSHKIIAAKRGMDENDFQAFYKILSSYTHFSPLSISVYMITQEHKFDFNFFEPIFLLITSALHWAIVDILVRMCDLWEIDIVTDSGKKILEKYRDYYTEEIPPPQK